MTHRTLLTAGAIIVFGVITACSDTTAPKSVAAGLPAATNSQQSDQDPSEPQSGALHVTKECTQYTGLAGGFCTITSSNLNTIKIGTRVVYASGVGPTGLDTDVLLVPPNSGQSTGFGHVVLSLVTRQGVITISGGTGKFKLLQASAVISYLGGRNWAWDGTYSFGDDD